MYEIEVHPIIKQVIKTLQLFGMWHKDGESVCLESGKKICHSMVSVSLFLSLSSGAYIAEDMSERIFLSAASTASALLIVKLSFILTKQSEVHTFLNEVCVHSVSNSEEFDDINSKLTNFAKFGYANIFSMLTSIFLFIILSLPFFSSEKRLPFNVGFPLDWKNSVFAYWLAHTFVISAVVFAMIITFYTIVYWYIMFNCSIKYKILGNKLRNFGTTAEKRLSFTGKQTTFVSDLINLVEYHRSIQEITLTFKSCFSNLFLAQILTSNLCICGSLYGLTFGSDSNVTQTVINVVVLVYNTFDIFMVLYFGNEITFYYSQLIYCLFESNWIDKQKSVKRNIIILMEVLKQPQELVILKLYPMNLETFTSVMKLTYSMFNILQHFDKN